MFPLPSFSTLAKIQKGGIDALKAVKILMEKGEISHDIVLMVDEMYLQKSTQYHSGQYVGADEEGNLYKGIVGFMIVGLKKSIPFIIKASPEIRITGSWLFQELESSVNDLLSIGFNVRGIVADNHSTNVNAFARMKKQYGSNQEDNHVTVSDKKIYLFFDNPHLMKNIRNNLLAAKKFVFPEFSFTIKNEEIITVPGGYISWRNLHTVYDMDENLKGNLRKAPELKYKALHPGNNKQSVPLALAIFAPTTIAAVKNYLPERTDIAGFLELISKWWIIINSNTRFSPNKLGNACTLGDEKTDFLRAFANYLETWRKSTSFFCLTEQTFDALIRTLRAQASLIDDLLEKDGYYFVVPRRFQSDPLERRFSRYRQMSGGRFLVSLREVLSSERIIATSSLLKEDIDFWKEDLNVDISSLRPEFIATIDALTNELQVAILCEESGEVASTIAGYITRKLLKRTKCNQCISFLVREGNDRNEYLTALSRGKLINPSEQLATFTKHAFAILDVADPVIQKYQHSSVKNAGEFVLKNYGKTTHDFVCIEHLDWGMKFASRIVVNCFYNNKQKLDTDAVRKSDVVAFKKRQRTK